MSLDLFSLKFRLLPSISILCPIFRFRARRVFQLLFVILLQSSEREECWSKLLWSALTPCSVSWRLGRGPGWQGLGRIGVHWGI